MCEYCDLDKYDGILSEDTDLALSFVKEDGDYYLMADDFYFHTDKKIKYCPFCGRKLGENNG